MFRNAKSLWRDLWEDDGGSILSAEYMMLGGIVVLGSVSGLKALRDASVSEAKEMGRSIRTIRQHYAGDMAATNHAADNFSNHHDQIGAQDWETVMP